MIQLKKVTNEEYTQAYKNLDNRRIMSFLSNRFRGSLDKDVLKSCVLYGLWRCLQYHDNNQKRKFTTSLYKFVQWECQRELARKQSKKIDIPTEIISDNIPDKEDYKLPTLLKDCLDYINEQDRQVLIDRYINNMTYEEIGKRYGCTKQSAKFMVTKILNSLQEKLGVCNSRNRNNI